MAISYFRKASIISFIISFPWPDFMMLNSEVFNDPKFKPYKGKVFKRTINVGGTTFVANDPVTPVAVALFETFSLVAPIENYIQDATEMKLQPWNGIRA